MRETGANEIVAHGLVMIETDDHTTTGFESVENCWPGSWPMGYSKEADGPSTGTIRIEISSTGS